MAWFKSLYTELHAGTFLQSSTKSTGRYLVLETVRNDEMMLSLDEKFKLPSEKFLYNYLNTGNNSKERFS